MKPGEYFYHWCILEDDKVIILGKNERDFSKITEDILMNHPNDTYKVIGTVETIEDMVNYFDKELAAEGILFLESFTEKDIFTYEHPFLVDKTAAVNK